MPGNERHPLDEQQNRLGIEPIGLRSLQQCFAEIGNRSRVRHHHLYPARPIKRQRQVETINAGRFHHHEHRQPLPSELFDQGLMTAAVVGERSPTQLPARGPPSHFQSCRTHIDAHTDLHESTSRC